MEKYLKPALKVHNYLVDKHWTGYAIEGPMPIGRVNWRITRFIKSYLDWLPWNDDYIYLQGQGYWIQDNLLLAEIANDGQYLDFVRACADYIVQIQLPNGAWKYPPLRERRHHLSSIEGAWASLGLIKAYPKLGEQQYLDAVLKWYSFQTNAIGFREYKDGLAINFLHRITSVKVPNATTLLLRLVAEIYKTTGDEEFLKYTDKMISFLEYSQMESGELQYHFESKPHFQCYQYNSFEFLDLAHYYELTQDERLRRILKNLADFLVTGVADCGASRYDCFKEYPEVNYWTAALGAALDKAHELGLGPYQPASDRAYQRLLTQQNDDGSFDFSRKNYLIFSDRRSYPQQLAMILHCLLLKVVRKAKSKCRGGNKPTAL